MSSFVKGILLAEGFAVTTFGLGWWSVPLVAAVFALLSASRNRALVAGICAAGGWATLLILDFAKGPVAMMGSKLGGVMHLSPAILYLATLLFPALLAWSAAALMPYLRSVEKQSA